MVADNRGSIEFRLCPTPEQPDEAKPLVEQHITEETCHKRQERAYHKCSKCALHDSAIVRREFVRIAVH